MTEDDDDSFAFEAEVIHWRGPSPFFFVPLPEHVAKPVAQLAKLVTYGWGMVPVAATIGGESFETSLFPKNAGYLLPLKDRIRRKLNVTAGDRIAVRLTVTAGGRPARRS